MSTQEPFDEWIRHKVEDLDNEPLEAFEPSAVWNKLYPELQPKRRPLAWWRWSAAAVVLLILGVMGWWVLPNSPDLAQAPSAPAPIKAIAASSALAKVVAKPSHTQPLASALAPSQSPNRRMAKRELELPNKQLTQPEATSPSPVPTSTPMPETASIVPNKLTEPPVLPPVASTEPNPAPVATVANAKPRFRVVHDNELRTEATQPSSRLAANAAEEKTGGFIVIPKSTNDPQANTNFVSYLRNKPQHP